MDLSFYRQPIVAVLALVACATVAQAQTPSNTNPVTVDGGTSLPPRGQPIFFDDFEINAARTANPTSLFTQRGWAGMKATNTNGNGASGYIYTQTDAARGSRVLAMEARPTQATPPAGWSYAQTDMYMQYGNETGPFVIPPDVWFQFWVQTTPDSRVGPADKMIYPCRTNYACSIGNMSWLLVMGRQVNEPYGGPSQLPPVGQWHLGVVTESANDPNAYEGPWNAKKLNQNLNHMRFQNGRWYQFKMHFNLAGAQGSWEAWVRERGTTAWTKFADYRGGVFPAGFTWPTTAAERQGHRIMRMPTTVNGQDGDSTTLWDDFAIAATEADLPP